MPDFTARENAELKWHRRTVPSIEEALARAEPGVTYECRDGWTVTFGRETVKFHA